MSFQGMVEKQRHFFAHDKTLSIDFRIEQLKKLKKLIQSHEKEIALALQKDLGKSEFEAITSDVMLTIKEINLAIQNLRAWSKPRRIKTPLALWPGRSTILAEPYGCVLILGAWNYPFLLVMSPLIGAMSAGNCVMIKPSEIAKHTAVLIIKLINTNFESKYLFAIEAGPKETELLLQEKFDYIFFTGSSHIGRKVMAAAAHHLTPLTLELGGKSPCIVDETANIDYAVRRITWAKMTNAGQTCIAPDYLYIHRSKKSDFVHQFEKTLHQFYGRNVEKSPNYARIVNQTHFDRLLRLLENGSILTGGQTNASSLYISPTLMDNISWNDPIMQEEIFGPILPILTYEHIDEVIHSINMQTKPLALYLFTQDTSIEDIFLKRVSFGGGCINDCIMHFVNLNLPFGGVGGSGMGRYHGKYSFETFSHYKSIYKKILALDFKLEYPPHSKQKFWLLRKLLQGTRK